MPGKRPAGKRNTVGLLAGKAARNGTLRHEGLRALKALRGDSDFQRILSSYDNGVAAAAKRFYGAIEADISWEHRAILYGPSGEPFFSARWDLMISARVNGLKCALIAEFKTGYYPVPEADRNLQTKAQAALAYYEEAHSTGEPYAKVATVVIQRSNVQAARPIVVKVAEPSELEAELDKIETEILAAESKGAELRTGKHCALCSAVHTCKAFKLLVEEVNDMGENLGFIRTTKDGKRRSGPVDSTRGIDKEKLAQFIASANVIKTALDRAKETAHAVLEKSPVLSMDRYTLAGAGQMPSSKMRWPPIKPCGDLPRKLAES